MNKLLSLITMVLVGIVLFSCNKKDVSTITKPLINYVVDKGTATSGGTQISLGPIKDYEQGSDVVYTFTVTSGSPLTKFSVNSTSDVVSRLSRVIKTEPENVIDTAGNFTQSVTSVKVYYAYRIDPLVPAGSLVTLSFNFQNQDTYLSTVSHSFTVIKINSTLGKKLQIMDFNWLQRNNAGIGTQDNFDIVTAPRVESTVTRFKEKRAPFVSFDLMTELGWEPEDAILNADKIDMVGFRARYPSTPLGLALNQFYLVSPSYTEMLGHMYIGCQYLHLNIVGTSGTAQISAAGLTFPLTFATNTTITATNFVNANKAAYAAIGLTLTSNAAALIWTVAAAPSIGKPYDPVKIINLTGDLTGNPIPQQGNGLTSDLKNKQFRDCVLSMDAKLKAAGSALRVARFKRLDNITGPSQVTIANFNTISHDNEFATIMAGIGTTGKLYTDALGFSQVWGFTLSDGRSGLLRTTDSAIIDPTTGGTIAPNAPNAVDYVLTGVIKVQQKP